MTTPPGPFDYERHTLRWSLQRLMSPNQDTKMLCTFVPRLVKSVTELAKVEASLRAEESPKDTDAVLKALRDLREERLENTEEEPTW